MKTQVFSRFKSFHVPGSKRSVQNIIVNYWLASSDWKSGKVYIEFLNAKQGMVEKIFYRQFSPYI